MENENLQQDAGNTNVQNNSNIISSNIPISSDSKKEKHKKILLIVLVILILSVAIFFIFNKNLSKKSSETHTVTNEDRLQTLERLDVMTDEMRANEATDQQKIDFLDRLDAEIPDNKGPKISQEELEKILNDTN